MEDRDEHVFSDSRDSDDSYDREQLEIALYSQIHFEENDELLENCNEESVNDNFTIDVQGNEKKGFVGNETSADLILKEGIEKKYGNVNDTKDSIAHSNRFLNVKTSHVKVKCDSVKDISPKRLTKQLEKQSRTSASTEISKSAQIQALLRDTLKSEQKAMTVEKLIRGNGSDEDEGNEDVGVDKDNGVEIISISGSDVDSLDVVLGESESDQDDIQMNVLSNPRFTYRKISGESASEEQHIDDADHWVISREDSYKGSTSSTRQGRYYKPIRCHNCNYVGHLSKNCPQPKKVGVCALCAVPGHICRNCPQSVCYNCEEPGHVSRDCSAPRRSLNYVCYRCNMQGHDQSQCPDHWRQYHVTVTPEKIQQFPRQTKRKCTSCYNCGDEGHFGHECDEERMNRFMRVSTPFICRYQSAQESQNTLRRYDEIEDRPTKRSRNEDWKSNDNFDRNSRDLRNKIKDTKTTDKSSEEKKKQDKDWKSYNDNFDRNSRDLRNKIKDAKTTDKNLEEKKKQDKKQSPFAHIITKHSNDKTGRNNFDKMQFTISNKQKQSSLPGKEIVVSSENSNKKKSKKGRKKKGKFDGQRDLQTTGKAGKEKRTNANEDTGKISRGKKTNNPGVGSKAHSNVNQRNVTSNMSNMNLVITTKSSANEHFSRSSNTNNDKKKLRQKDSETDRFNAEDLFSLWSIDSKELSEKEITGDNKRVAKLDKVEERHLSVWNDSLRPDDLFSMQKIEKLQSGGVMDVPLEEDDMEHQVHNNEWWNKRKKKRAGKRTRKKYKKKLNVC